jgi:hydrogenase expression/formation protein HypC
MCLAIPGKVTQIDRDSAPLMGTVSFGGIQKTVCLEWVPEVQLGQYVIVHVGFALNTMDEQEALETLRLFEEAGNSLDELREGDPSPGEDA